MTDRIALVVGVNDYEDSRLKLTAAVNDAVAVKRLIERHADDELNFGCRLLTSDRTTITRRLLRQELEQLFSPDIDGDILFYFSGHGRLTPEGGVLVTHDGVPGDWGVGMAELMALANQSRAANVLIMLDCCHAGAAGAEPMGRDGFYSTLRDNVTVITASSRSQSAGEAGIHGFFTQALIDALEGGGADMLGDVSPSAIYRCIERRSNNFGQRPIYKSSTTRSFVVRHCPPVLPKSDLRKLPEIFSTPEARYALDPEYEPDEPGAPEAVAAPAAVPWKQEISQLFKRYRNAALLRPCDPKEQLYWTARRSHSVELTPAGKEWWHVAKANRV
jgi:hypothetical protein